MFLVLLFALFAVAIVVNYFWSSNMMHRQTEKELIEKEMTEKEMNE
jgi:hypothetical protein